MADFLLDHRGFAPYLAALLVLAVMSVREGHVGKKGGLRRYTEGCVHAGDQHPLFAVESEQRSGITILNSVQLRTTCPGADA